MMLTRRRKHSRTQQCGDDALLSGRYDIVIASARRTQTVIGRKHETIKALARVATGEGERWSHGSNPLTGQELRRELLGTCANGRLFLRPNGKGIDLYWSNSNLSPGFDEKLRALLKTTAPIAVTKPVNGLHLGCLGADRRVDRDLLPIGDRP